jgi:hypothetical protein
MVLEWIRRRDPVFDEQLRKYLFTSDPITGRESTNGEAAAGKGAAASSGTIGSLRGGDQ